MEQYVQFYDLDNGIWSPKMDMENRIKTGWKIKVMENLKNQCLIVVYEREKNEENNDRKNID